MARVVVYTRISRPDREDYKGGFRTESTPTQRQAQELREYHEKQGDTITEVIEETVSASSLKENEIDLEKYLAKRPKLKALIDKASAGQHDFEVVSVWRHDRLARDAFFQEGIIRKLKGLGVRIFSLFSSNETLTRRVQGVIDQEEIEVIRKRTRAGLKARAEAGKVVSQPPFGYTSSRITHKMLPIRKEADVVIAAFSEYADGHSLRQIADKHFRGSIPRAKTILSNPSYTGRYTWKEVYVEKHHKPLIDDATFEKAQERLKSEPVVWRKGRMPKHLRSLA